MNLKWCLNSGFLVLFVLYHCPCVVVGETVTACYGVTGCRYYSLACKSGTVIQLTSLQYGSKKNKCFAPTCRGDCCKHQADDCLQNMTQGHVDIVHDACSGKETCVNLDATQGHKGKCNQYPTYILIQYDCIAGKKTTTEISKTTTVVSSLSATPPPSSPLSLSSSSSSSTIKSTPSTTTDTSSTISSILTSSSTASSGIADDDDDVSPILVGVLVPLLVIIAASVALFIWWKRHKPMKDTREPARTSEYVVEDIASPYAEISSVPSDSAGQNFAAEPIYDPVYESRNGNRVSVMDPINRDRNVGNLDSTPVYDPVYEPSCSGNHPAFISVPTKKNKNMKTKASEKFQIPAKMIKDKTDKIIAFFRKQPDNKPSDKEIKLQKMAENVVESYNEINITPTGTVEMAGRRGLGHETIIFSDEEMKLPKRKIADSVEIPSKLPAVVNIGNGYMDFVFENPEQNKPNTDAKCSGPKQRPAKPSRPPPRPFSKDQNNTSENYTLVDEQDEPYPYAYADNNPAIRTSFDDVDSDDNEDKIETSPICDAMGSDGYLSPVEFRQSFQELDNDDDENLSITSNKSASLLGASGKKNSMSNNAAVAINGLGKEIETGTRYDSRGNEQEKGNDGVVKSDNTKVKDYENVLQVQTHENKDAVDDNHLNDRTTTNVFKMAKLFENNQ